MPLAGICNIFFLSALLVEVICHNFIHLGASFSRGVYAKQPQLDDRRRKLVPLVLVVGIIVGHVVRAASCCSEPPKPAEACQNITKALLPRPFLVQFVEREGLETEFLIWILAIVFLLLLLVHRRDSVPARRELRVKMVLEK